MKIQMDCGDDLEKQLFIINS